MSLHLSIFDHYIEVAFSEPSPKLQRRISDLVRYEMDGARFKDPRWGGQTNTLFKYNRFPTGFLNLLWTSLNEWGVEFDHTDNRQPVSQVPDVVTLEGITYRPYQEQVIQRGLKDRRAVFQFPPGTGKTEMLCGLARSINLPALWLCSSLNVLEQSKRRWVERGGGPDLVLFALASTLQNTLKKLPKPRREKWLNHFKVLLVDEVHHIAAHSWYEIAMNCNAAYRFGVSATPEDRKQGPMELHAAISEVTVSKTYEECYEQKYLSRPTIRILHYKTPTVVSEYNKQPKSRFTPMRRVKTTNWHSLYRDGIAEHATRNSLAVKEAHHYHDMGYPPIIMVRLIKHAKKMYDLCSLSFDEVGLITGDSKDEERINAIKGLLEGDTQVLISSLILGEGQDMPNLAALINLAAGYSTIQTVQITGRTMRPQTPAFLSDFFDTQHGILCKHSKIRLDTYKGMGVKIEMVNL